MTLEDILYRLPKKRLLELRDARVNRLIDETKAAEIKQKEEEAKMIRGNILRGIPTR